MIRAARAVLVAGLMVAAGIAGAADPEPRRIAVDGEPRRYLLVPPPETPGPIIIALHGEGGLVRGFRNMTGLDAAAARFGWGVAYLQGRNNSWNSDLDGPRMPNDRAPTSDDRRFIDAVIEALEARGVAMLGRIAIVGYGRGGAMAFRYACDRADRILGVGIVVGFIHANAPCAPRTAATVVMIYGDADPIHPVAGGRVDGRRIPGGRARAAPLVDGLAAWRSVAPTGCVAQTAETPLSPNGLTLVGTVGCGVDRYIVAGGGHYWPGGDQLENAPVYGVQPVGFDASGAIAAAFAAADR